MTKSLTFTEASLARAIKGVQRAGLFVVGVKPDGTLIVGDKPIDVSSLVPPKEMEQSPPPKRRLGDYFNGSPETSKWEDRRG
ncbi:hypothetical protein AS156_23095 [Bradyrhizobium macuxiense]|uniref:Uncharacterized protein n=1 Tax=Bradyrhizobium macuxiense TaxID=1755647 RepID=A0A120FHG5_9BRAD|nr:hypothetical protein [Bradyrhizobium macuxiense]KWV45902.1 hypothetical protein AS156_23095 [Bradyrhizobium macuxiense]